MKHLTLFTTLLTLTLIGAVLFCSPVANSAQTINTIQIASIGVDAPIVNVYIRNLPDGITWDFSKITTEVGYLEQTSWFGQGSNIVLGSHSQLAARKPGVFYYLDQVEVGDEILVNENGNERRYVVDKVTKVNVNDLTVLYPTDSERLTLITCDKTLRSSRIVVTAAPV